MMEATDQLVCYLQSLDECLTLKRLILQEECKFLNSLLLPWKRHKESKTSNKPVPAENIQPATVDVVEEEILDPIDEELAKVNKLLEKVHKVRSNVKDDEVRVMCKIESSESTDKLPEIKRISKGVTIDSSAIKSDTRRNHNVPNGQTEVTKPLSANKQTRSSTSSRFKPAKPATQTSYQSSYKPPSSRQVRVGGQVTSKIASRPKSDITAARHKVSGDWKSEKNAMNPARISKVVNSNTTDDAFSIPSSVTNSETPPAGASNSLTEKTAGPEASEEKFTLKTNGKELKVPKSMRVQMKLQQEFRAKADYIVQASKAPALPDKLRKYYIASENIPIK